MGWASARRRWVRGGLAVLTCAAIAAGVTAVERSVTVQVRWSVLPYQTLRIEPGSGDRSPTSYVPPEPSALDRERGYIEDENAIRLDVISNIPWKLQISAAGPAAPGVLLREHGGEYTELGAEPKILARGRNGAYGISVDYRIPIDGSTGAPAIESIEVVYAIIPD